MSLQQVPSSEENWSSSSQASMEDPESSLPPGTFVETPRPMDVMGSKHKSQHKHPGNMIYREAVEKAVQAIDMDRPGEPKRSGERIVDMIMIDRKGVFLRKSKKEMGWYAMSRKEAIVKAVGAIRNRLYAAAKPPFKKKPPKKVKVSSLAKKPKAQIEYEALAGTNTKIHAYALKMITAVCNKPEKALRVLESPLPQIYPRENEPEQARTMRLQLRHRYAAALSTGMSPIDFSKTLLELWGGSLVEIRPETEKVTCLETETEKVACPRTETEKVARPETKPTEPKDEPNPHTETKVEPNPSAVASTPLQLAAAFAQQAMQHIFQGQLQPP